MNRDLIKNISISIKIIYISASPVSISDGISIPYVIWGILMPSDILTPRQNKQPGVITTYTVGNIVTILIYRIKLKSHREYNTTLLLQLVNKW